MRVERLSSLAGGFDGVLLDQFGVLHDGHRLYPGALEVLEGLKSSEIPVAILTNSGKRTAANRERLLSLGVPRDTFVDVVTSGELAYHSLMVGFEVTGRAPYAFIVGTPGEEYGFDLVPTVDDPKAADVILFLGSDAPRTSLDAYRELLGDAKAPAICCNPDRWRITRDGLQPGAGAIAEAYAQMGGQVTWIGKPYPEIYLNACASLGGASRVLCVGDSAEHDVAGGRSAGLTTMLVMTGVSDGLDGEHVEPRPDYWMERLRW
jgi:HAD superfamily hydrolase (TIGR01459 family)